MFIHLFLLTLLVLTTGALGYLVVRIIRPEVAYVDHNRVALVLSAYHGLHYPQMAAVRDSGATPVKRSHPSLAMRAACTEAYLVVLEVATGEPQRGPLAHRRNY